ncbi:scavenger receptor cysteine-rich type 1 protein M130-like [Parambassis ranga]|uniref:Scavenger receptor cysteine-rich type 1 protein M130-like n=1 Tax=Parambassis ranga TaxID=210632 RepID=A0A6P7JEB5_9TELE|nr:scavenger receptor cysteine-rich type 1 protein M130-like [Parambassis ranga]
MRKTVWRTHRVDMGHRALLLLLPLWSSGLCADDTHSPTETDKVRLVGGASRCTGVLEVKKDGEWRAKEDPNFYRMTAAAAVCSQLDCGSVVSVQEAQSPPGRAQIHCSDSVRLVEGTNMCSGRLEVKSDQSWSSVCEDDFNLQNAEVVCRELGCGAPSVFKGGLYGAAQAPVWMRRFQCGGHESALLDCGSSQSTENSCSAGKAVGLTCSDSVRLVEGTNVCSGRLEVKSDQSWSSVCEDDFNLQNAEVVCRELGCGAPSVLQAALYGEVEPLVWSKEFQCGGHESALLDCGSSQSTENSCSAGKAVGLTCSDHVNVRLVGGANRCSGTLEVKHNGEWREVYFLYSEWTLKAAAVICGQLDCGSPISTSKKVYYSPTPVWLITPSCVQSKASIKECVLRGDSDSSILNITCSDSVRLVEGTNVCSGRLEVKSDQSWSSVCIDDFNLQNAEVVCRELDCGAPSVLQGALYGEVEPLVWSKEFQCGGHESALLDCGSSQSTENSCSAGKAVGLTCSNPDDVRLVGGANRCSGRLEVKHNGEWREVNSIYPDWTLKAAAVVCGRLDCGSVVSTTVRSSGRRPVWTIIASCIQNESIIKECVLWTSVSSSSLEISCSDSVRLVEGTNVFSGRLEVKSDQSWSSVCEDDFNLQNAEVVCRELGCGAPSVFKGGLYGAAEAPVWMRRFQCGGHESALLDCGSSQSTENSCSAGKAVGLTCSDPDNVRLVGGANRCSGTLELKHNGEWREVEFLYSECTLKAAAVICGQLDCGSPISTSKKVYYSPTPVWVISTSCVQSEASIKECVLRGDSASSIWKITCSDSVRLVEGTNVCSGRLEVKSDQSWSSVCEDDFNLQNAEVVCRELGCGAPSVFKGGLYGAAEAPVWMRRFQCGGHESALLDCGSSQSTENSCSAGKAVGLTCSDHDDVRLVGGANHCSGRLEVKHNGEWREVDDYDSGWTLKQTAVICQWLDCGSPLSSSVKDRFRRRPLWLMKSSCVQFNSTTKECVTMASMRSSSLEISCSDSVRLVEGTNVCSGRLEVKSDQSWSSVCEYDFNLQNAEVVCRELSCGAPSVFKGGLYGAAEAPVWMRRFQCGGHESALLDCGSSQSTENSCSAGKAVGLTCSDPDDVRLVGGANRCSGRLELKHNGEWREVDISYSEWTLKQTAVMCRRLVCVSPFSASTRDYFTSRPVWRIQSSCIQHESKLKECVLQDSVSSSSLEITCTELLARPNISLSASTDGVSQAEQQGFWVLIGSTFGIMCSVEPQYQGGSFQLMFTSSNTAQNYTLPAVNHSALFLFSAADHTHRGTYTCVYHNHVSSRDFSSVSQPRSLAVLAPLTELIIRVTVVLLAMTSSITAICCYYKPKLG